VEYELIGLISADKSVKSYPDPKKSIYIGVQIIWQKVKEIVHSLNISWDSKPSKPLSLD
jgi:hypothetical protein